MPESSSSSYTVPEPIFAEWAYYNVNYGLLSSLAPDTAEACSCQTDGEDAAAERGCSACEAMAEEYRRQLEKVSSFLHMKGSELEHSVRSCEHYLMTLSTLDHGEQLVGLGQTEETISSAMGQILALARFRRSNFTALWRPLDRLRTRCNKHHEELLDLVASSPLFRESSLETQQLYRTSQMYNAIMQAGYAGGGFLAESEVAALQAFPSLALWRGWISPNSIRRVHKLMCARLSPVYCGCACSNGSSLSQPTMSVSGLSAAADPSPCTSAQKQRKQQQEEPLKGTDSRESAPPSSPQAYKSSASAPAPAPAPASISISTSEDASPAPSIKSLSKNYEDMTTVYFDSTEMARYKSGFSAESTSKDSLELWWSESGAQTVHLEHSTYSGPWFAAGATKSGATLESRYVIPFLNSEFNFDRLRPPPTRPQQETKPMTNGPAAIDVEEDDEATATRRRVQARNMQRIQRSIIMENLKPVLATTEKRTEYVDAANPDIRVALRRHVVISHDEQMQQCTQSQDSPCWLQRALDGAASNGSIAEHLPFAIIEVHLANHSVLPEWLAHLFFESTLVHPVLDFDLYSHGIALLKGDAVEDLPYWLVDYHRNLFQPPLSAAAANTASSQVPSPTAHSTSSQSLQIAAEGLQSPHPDPQDYPCESTRLLPLPVSSAHSRTAAASRYSVAKRARYYLCISLLAAMALGIALAIWPYHERLMEFLAELADLIAQWVARMLLSSS
ncbi:hypothetical protein GQ54DRAFT_297527 [Martensiomyces pterosporus]|nr:hypothetical protein GQ54DRAFT_297527 [Martensiomyces pterosporus]